MFSSVPRRAGDASALLVTLIEDVFVRRVVMTVTCSHLPRVFYLEERCAGREPPAAASPQSHFTL